jgi:hypothetical protein
VLYKFSKFYFFKRIVNLFWRKILNRENILIIILIFITQFSCGKKIAGTPEEVFEKLSKTENFKDAELYFTNGTIKLINSAVSKGILDEKDRFNYLPAFNKKSKWEILNTSNNGNTAGITLRFTKHPIENLKGTDITYNLVKEDGAWKIDLEKEMKDSLSTYEPNNAEKYLKDMLK